MILFLQYAAGGKRGGEQYTERLHRFLLERYTRLEPVKLQPRPSEYRSIARHARASLNMIRQLRPELVITDVSSGARNVIAINWARRNGIKVMIIIQENRMTFRFGNRAPIRWAIKTCENYLLRSADIVLSNSKYIASFVRTKARKECSIIIAHPGIQIIGPTQEKFGFSSRPAEDPFRMLFVGEWTEPRKGLKFLLKALAQLGDFKIQLNLAGGYSDKSPEYAQLMELIEKNNLYEIVKIHGFLNHERLPALYSEADIFVLPSLSEGYGMALAEAMAFGLPVVASNVAAIPEMITHNENGLLVDPKNPQALALAIRQLIEDAQLRTRMSRANIEKAKTLPTWADFEATLNRELVPEINRLIGLRE